MLRADFHYDLPDELIARHPAARRSDSRLLHLDGRDRRARRTGVRRPAAPAARRRPAGVQRHARHPGAAVRPQGERRPRRALARARARRRARARAAAREQAARDRHCASSSTAAARPRVVEPRRRLLACSSSTRRARRGLRALRRDAAAAVHAPRRPRTPIASATRPSSRASPARWRRPPPACISTPDCSTACASARRAESPTSRCTSAPAPSSRCASTTSPSTACTPSGVHGARRDLRRRSPRRARAAGAWSPSAPPRCARSRPRRGTAALAPYAGETRLFITPGLSLPGRRRAGHQLPPAGVDPADAGVRLRRPRAGARGLPHAVARALPLLQLRRRHVRRAGRRGARARGAP